MSGDDDVDVDDVELLLLGAQKILPHLCRGMTLLSTV